jgi:cold shock CspA family protein
LFFDNAGASLRSKKGGKVVKGFDLENRIIELLGKDWVIERSQDLDQLGIDALVHRFIPITSFSGAFPIALQITSYVDDSNESRRLDEIQGFVQKMNRNGIKKSIYAEFKKLTLSNINSFGYEFLKNALVSFAFQKEYKDVSIVGLRISSPDEYAFFSVTESSSVAAHTFHNGKQAAHTAKGDDLSAYANRLTQDEAYESGKIFKGRVKIFQHRWGFLIADAIKENVYFHISNVEDEMLTEKLEQLIEYKYDSYSKDDTDVVDVEFRIGRAKPNAAKPFQAINIKTTQGG